MTSKTLKIGEFVVVQGEINEIQKGSVGLIKKVEHNQINVFFIGNAQMAVIDVHDIAYLDIDKTGKPYDYKICNICHILKKDKQDFDINQTDAQGRKTTRPSCRECRKKIDGKQLTQSERKKLDRISPKRKELFTCPICEKTTIVGVTARVVRDHDHNTGKARTWICDSCNTGLGRFKDDIRFIKKIIRYLEKYSGIK